MRWRDSIVISLLLMCCSFAAAKKKKVILPADILEARTVLVVIDPDAGTAIDDPNANNTARADVESAILKWGRFTLATDVSTADLVIMVRKGNGKVAEPTIGGLPNNRPLIFQPATADSDPRIGASRGTPPMAGDPTAPQRPSPHPSIEAAPKDDMMTVFRGKRDDVLDSPPVWRYSAKDALESPSVPAVEAFRKLIAEAEKQQANHP